MEDALALLKRKGLLITWSDHNILPGEKIPEKVRDAMNDADIIVFLFSQSFIASTECMNEWEYAIALSENKTLPYRVPIILSKCAWLDVLDEDRVKALPNDGQPVNTFQDPGEGWHQIYEGIKLVVETLRATFAPKARFISELAKTEFISTEPLDLREIFVFPTLLTRGARVDQSLDYDRNIVTEKQIRNISKAFIHGEEVSGKTALARHIFFAFLGSPERTSVPIYIDFDVSAGANPERLLATAYNDEYTGDFSLWNGTKGKILILENMSPHSRCTNFLLFAKEHFDKIFVTVSSDIYHSFFLDDARFAEFVGIKIETLDHNQQEQLIRNMLTVSQGGTQIPDGLVDQLENRVNSIIISNKIVPRYPFYVLSILQAQEHFMPDVSITSYGHCYYVLIVAHLIKSGISSKDMDLNACFNFLENLAFSQYQIQVTNLESKKEEFEFAIFLREYSERYFTPKSVVNRLSDKDYGLISSRGEFGFRYMYYYFLGRYFANNKESTREIVEDLCDRSHIGDNQVIILFLVHHTNDDEVIEDILIRSICTLGDIAPAKLSREETARFAKIVESMPASIQSDKAVEDVRRAERESRDRDDEERENGEIGANGSLNEEQVGVYRILKSNEILGQILRNKFGILPKDQIEEIIETISDGGLRLVNSFLENEKKISECATFIHTRFPDLELERVKLMLQGFSFFWTMINIEQVVQAINIPEISKGVDSVVQRQSTPAYDLVGYFNLLDGAEKLEPHIVNRLSRLLDKNRDPFFKRVVSRRTQHYMNSHLSKESVEQAMCSALGLKYVPRKRKKGLEKSARKRG